MIKNVVIRPSSELFSIRLNNLKGLILKNIFDHICLFLVHFASSNCDEDNRKITEKKSYNLTWNGQITPKLCSFSFTGGETFITDAYE
jgi:hypothetical protein